MSTRPHCHLGRIQVYQPTIAVNLNESFISAIQLSTNGVVKRMVFCTKMQHLWMDGSGWYYIGVLFLLKTWHLHPYLDT